MITNQNKNKVYIIAEAGVNHNGDFKIALKMIDEAVKSGADAVKFQTFISNNLASEHAQKADYQKKTTNINEKQIHMLKKLELKKPEYKKLKQYCRKKRIDFLTTAFDEESLDFITNDLKVKKLKIPSGEITNGPLLLKHGLTGLDIILSTGMSTIKEIETALGVILFGYINRKTKNMKPSLKAFKNAYKSKKGKKYLRNKISILHCTTEYPAPFEELNLNAMKTIRNTFNVDVGYSDHSKGLIVPSIAAAMGAKIIEKHFTLDKNMKGPDHKASINANELKQMVEQIRFIENIKGSEKKLPSSSEIKNIEVARKSIIAKKNIKIGELFSVINLTAKRPGSGKTPMDLWKTLGKKSNKNYDEDDIIE